MKHKRPTPLPPVVETLTVTSKDKQQIVQAMGTVKPDRSLSLKSRVSGSVIRVSKQLEPGERIQKGTLLVTLDPADYRIEVQKAQSALDKALADLAIEQGKQSIAREELKMINEASGENIQPTDLSLRKPQLKQARAAVDNARANLEKARLNLDRTELYAPFNALVLEKNISIGSQISTQESLAVLVDYDQYNIEALVPLDRLSAIDFTSGACCTAHIHSPAGNGGWSGQVVRTTGTINEKSRMAGVIIKVEDPLGVHSNHAPLMLDDYVSVDIYGKTVKNLFKLPRSVLRDQDTVWIYQSGILDIRPVTIEFKEQQHIYVSEGLNQGEQIIKSDLPIPVSGMPIQLSEDAS